MACRKRGRLGLDPVKKTILESCGRIGHKACACFIGGLNFIPTSLRIKINQSNSLRGDEPTEPPREWNNQPPEVHFKYRTSPPKTSPVVLYIIGRLNCLSVDNGYVEVYPVEYPFEYTCDSVTDPDTASIKSIYDGEIYQLLKLFHSEHDNDILDVDLHMLQYLLVVSASSTFYSVSTVLFINMQYQKFLYQISCHTFLCSSHLRPMWDWIMETQYMPK